MSNLRNLLLCTLAALVPAVGFAQAPSPSPGPPAPLGGPSSDISRLTRERETNAKFFNKTMATLYLTYNGAGDLRSSLVKTELNSLFMTVEVNGQLIKGIAKNDKPKLQEAVAPGPLTATGRWMRPGTRRDTKCTGELTVGLHQILFLPYGGIHGFSCQVEPRTLPDEAFDKWQAGLDADQVAAYADCASQHPRGSAELWACIDGAGIPLPQA